MRKLITPTLFLIFVCAILALDAGGVWPLPGGVRIATFLTIAAWAAGAFFAGRVATALVRYSFAQRVNRTPPRLLLGIVSTGIWLVLACAMAVVEFGASPTAAIATYGVALAVVGIALRSLVSDLMYGITMAIERPFEIGEWIQLSDGIVGRVDEMTWRAVKLTTTDNLMVVTPNSKLAMEQIVNYDQPEPFWRKTQRITLSYDVRPEKVAQLLHDAVRQVPESHRIPREPDVRVVGYSENGVEWELRYWVPNYHDATLIAEKIHEALLRNLRFAGIRVPRPGEEVFLAPLEAERETEQTLAAQWIDQVELFSTVPSEHRRALQAQAPSHEVEVGTEIVRQGETGASLFVIRRGAFDVIIHAENGGAEHVGTLGPGAVVGELSLLTGAPRSATIRAATTGRVHEITKDDLEPLLRAHPELAEDFARILADRRLADAHRESVRNATVMDDERRGMVANLLKGARSFFKLSA